MGKESEFVVRLPLAGEAAIPEVSGMEMANAAGKRVLVIEDNADAAESLREVLELGGHIVAVATTGPEGVTAARSFDPDVVLCDIGLPGMDGYEVARTLRADPSLRSTLLVALSGYALPEDLEKAQAAGFDEHVAKPASLERLEQLIVGVRRYDDTALRSQGPQAAPRMPPLSC